MPQEISVSYLAIKNKVYRLIDAMVVGEKSEAEVQESVRRWWSLIHPADRPIAKKYLMAILGRSMSALDMIVDTVPSTDGREASYPLLSSDRTKLMERIMKDDSVPSPV
jgi:hypothetical protein